MERDAKSIHFRRRWFYVLWLCLLLASLAALVLWETPSRSGKVNLQIQVLVKQAPQGCRVQVWVGPGRKWQGKLSDGREVRVNQAFPEVGKVVASLELPVAYRRWTRQYIPGQTADLVVLVFTPPTGSPRYLGFHLDTDLNTGLLRPGRGMKLSLECAWEGLWNDPLTLPDTP